MSSLTQTHTEAHTRRVLIKRSKFAFVRQVGCFHCHERSARHCYELPKCSRLHSYHMYCIHDQIVSEQPMGFVGGMYGEPTPHSCLKALIFQ